MASRLPDMRRRPIDNHMDRDEIRRLRREHYDRRSGRSADDAVSTADLTPTASSPGAPSTTTEGQKPADDGKPQVVPIPENWREMAWPQLRKLAADVTGHPITKRDEALTALEQEVERRKA